MCLCQFELVEWHATARKLTLKLKMETIMLIICKKKRNAEWELCRT